MPGLFGMLGADKLHVDREPLLNSIDLAATCDTHLIEVESGCMAVAWLRGDVLLTERFLEDAEVAACLTGDIVDYDDVPWAEIKASLMQRRYAFLGGLKGTFAISLFDKKNRRVFVISDRTSQQALYYAVSDAGIVFSTAIATFCRMPRRPQFNHEWLYEFLYFNYPVHRTSVLAGVNRMDAASVLEFEPGKKNCTITTYADPFKRSERLRAGEEAMEYALSVFKARVPKYYARRGQTAVSLTAGFDSRTVLAFAPSVSSGRIETYTYGIPGCDDLLDASVVSSALGLKHHEIALDDRFVAELAGLIKSTIYLSNAQERVIRATLPYVYRTLTDNARNFPVTVTGISGDHLFRDHIRGAGNVPSIISADMMKTIYGGRTVINAQLYERAFGGEYPRFKEHIIDRVHGLNERFGNLSKPESYLSFLVYVVASWYFGGEAAVANNYTNLRSPFWDSEIIQLAYELELGTLGFSESLSHKDKYLENVLQSHMIHSRSAHADLHISGVPVGAFARNNRTFFQFSRLLWRVPARIKSFVKRVPDRPVEDWRNWFDKILAGEISGLLSGEMRILQYLQKDFIEETKAKRDIHWLGKVMTAEIVLMLISGDWNIL